MINLLTFSFQLIHSDNLLFCKLICQFPDVIFIKQVVNLGFAGGVNVGVKYAIEHNYKYVALLNNDATADKDWLKNLIAASQKNKSSITTGLMLNESGDYIDSAGEYFSSWGISFPGSRNNPASSSPNSSFVFGATGGGVLYETSLFQNIELFDEKFFLYFEDTAIIKFLNTSKSMPKDDKPKETTFREWTKHNLSKFS
jgi:GT2 family glycosyltransferase